SELRSKLEQAQSMAHRLRAWLEPIIRSQSFDYFIVGVIVLNAITLGLDTSSAVKARISGLLLFVDVVILTIFVLEISAKLFVTGRHFWRDPWNVFDFAIVLISVLPATGNLSILRSLRIVR